MHKNNFDIRRFIAIKSSRAIITDEIVGRKLSADGNTLEDIP
jgi:hypothetical protein